MIGHPLFDERVIERMRAISDELVKVMPDSIAAVNAVLRPGDVATLAVTFPDGPPPENWSLPEPVAQAGRDMAAAWLATGHPMPALQFVHRRNDEGRWQANLEPLLEW